MKEISNKPNFLHSSLKCTKMKVQNILGKDGRYYNEDTVATMIDTNNAFLEKALIKIYDRQTRDEKNTRETKHLNNVGFNAAHAKVMSYYARWVLSGRNLSGSHLQKAKRILRSYRKQILEEIALANPLNH